MPLKPCIEQGCGTLSPGTRCPPHQRATDNARSKRRGTTAQRGLSGQHAATARAIRHANPPCACPGCNWHQGLCGLHGTPDNPITAGHITARANGGTSDPSNIRAECRRCNSSRGAR